MPKSKRQREQFDVADFLRPTDEDLRSALSSLLGPGPNAVLPEKTPQESKSDPGINLIPGPELTDEPDRPTISGPGIKLVPGPELSENKKRRFPIREMKLAQDAHTRAEQQLYEALWGSGKPHDEVSRILTIGFGGMARLARLSESNARLNLRSLVAKLALEELGRYDCERSIGRTYRIYNYSEILLRRKEAGLTWYTKRTQGVFFVDPKTGQQVNSGRPADLVNSGPPPGLNLIPPPGLNLIPPPGLNLIGLPYIENLLLREEDSRENYSSSSSGKVVVRALTCYGPVDDDVVQKLIATCRTAAPDCTEEEIVHFIHEKGKLVQTGGQESRISNPIGFLLTAVPKCFAGDTFQLYREQSRKSREQEKARQQREEAEADQWKQQQEAILSDPNSSEDDKRLARRVLGLTP